MKYKVGEEVEVRSQHGYYTGWKLLTITGRHPNDKYRVDYMGDINTHYYTIEPCMRRPSKDNEASGDSFADLMKGLGVGELT